MSDTTSITLEQPDVPSGLGTLLSTSWSKLKKFAGDQYRQHISEVLKCGPVPRHVAFIMDGNRRFARKLHAETKTGHTLGGQTLMDTLRWCTELDINAITVFAFSIENFKRTTEEVDALMQIAHDKLGELLHRPEAKQYFRIRGVGDMSLLPQFLQNRIREIEELTKNNEAGELNVCFSYSSTNEITSAVKQVVSHHLHNHPENTIKHGSLGENSKPSKMGDEEEDEEVTQAELERCLQTYGSPDIDMIVRTSGEIRLSDFMLWQSSASCLVITDVLWPEFSAMHLYSAVLYYQEHYESLKAIRSTLQTVQSNLNLDHSSINIE